MEDRAQLNEHEAVFARAERVARLATANAEGHLSIVPICYAFDGIRFYSPLDEKPKRTGTRNLQRVRNIRERGEASLLIDRYEDDWSQLGYLLIQAKAELIEPGGEAHAHALLLLRERYPQYQTMDLETQPVIALDPRRITSWGPALTQEATIPANGWLKPGRGLDFQVLARNRRSVRAFQDRPVPRRALENMLEAAAWAPSPHGRQPWRFVVLTHEQPKQMLAAAMGSEWHQTLAMDGESEDIIGLRLEKSRERIRSAPALSLSASIWKISIAIPIPAAKSPKRSWPSRALALRCKTCCSPPTASAWIAAGCAHHSSAPIPSVPPLTSTLLASSRMPLSPSGMPPRIPSGARAVH